MDKKEKIDFFKIGRLKESLPFASEGILSKLTKYFYSDILKQIKGKRTVVKRRAFNIMCKHNMKALLFFRKGETKI